MWLLFTAADNDRTALFYPEGGTAMERMPRRWRSIPAEEVQRKFDESTPEQYANGGLGNGPYALPPASSRLHLRLLFSLNWLTEPRSGGLR